MIIEESKILFDLISSRHSVRSYLSEPVEPDHLEFILKVTNQAPSAGNLQAYEIFVIEDQEVRSKLAQAAFDQDFISQAPMVLVFFANPARSRVKYRDRGEALYCIQDATIACTFAMLATNATGLSTVWVGAFNEKSVLEILGISEKIKPIAMLPIGYSKSEASIRTRRDLSDLVHYIDR